MMKVRNIAVALLLVSPALFFSSAALAGKRPNPNRGKSLFKTTCKLCHVKDGDAKFLSPMSKTQAQWKRFFKNEKKIGACVEASFKKTGTKLSADDLNNMSYYLVKHAADSDQPETCGQ